MIEYIFLAGVHLPIFEAYADGTNSKLFFLQLFSWSKVNLYSILPAASNFHLYVCLFTVIRTDSWGPL